LAMETRLESEMAKDLVPTEEEEEEEEEESSASTASSRLASQSAARPSSLDYESDDEPKPKFSVLDKVYARDDRGILYKAVIRRSMYAPMKIVLNEKGEALEDSLGECWHYFVHYLNWNAKWDRWVKERDVYEDRQETRELILILNDALKKNKKRKDVVGKLKEIENEFWANRNNDKSLGNTNKDQTAKTEEQIRQEKQRLQQVNKTKEFKLKQQNLCMPRPQSIAERIILPVSLKRVLVNDWESITLLKLLPILPSTLPIQSILHKYLQSKLDILPTQPSKEHDTRNHWIQAVTTLTNLFDQTSTDLFYIQEHPHPSHLQPSTYFGCEFLLRFFVRLPYILPMQAELDKRRFCSKVNDLVRYLNKFQDECFIQMYRKVPCDAVQNGLKTKRKNHAGNKRQKLCNH